MTKDQIKSYINFLAVIALVVFGFVVICYQGYLAFGMPCEKFNTIWYLKSHPLPGRCYK